MATSNKLARLINKCRVCLNKDLKLVIDLGTTPPANAFLKKSHLKKVEKHFPLKVNFCKLCGQLQLTHSVSPDLLFNDYVYFSSTSPVFIKHFQDYAKQVFEDYKLTTNSLVVDIGSNDGILLKPFKELGVRILGVDPAKEIAKIATKNGLPTLPYFFDQKIARKILQKHGSAKVISGNNVFAHIPDSDTLLKSVNILLDKDGIFVVEFPYLIDFLQKNLFDTIYHEHVSYFSIRPLVKLFQRFKMEIIDVKKVSSHGGSVRVFVKKSKSTVPIQPSVAQFIKQELDLNLHKTSTYRNFAKQIKNNKKDLVNLLNNLKKEGKQIAGFGAPGKGNTLLNYFGIDTKHIDYIVDDSPAKQNLYTPGTHIPVVHPKILEQQKPDYLLILAWNFAEPIIERYKWFKQQGGRFIVPVPRPTII